MITNKETTMDIDQPGRVTALEEGGKVLIISFVGTPDGNNMRTIVPLSPEAAAAWADQVKAIATSIKK